ncbi:MAG: FHA domain-containing protein [Candidatus Schekmanbacteria bacterium]|nr:FHA domain-containing protein [Candidatus Schekmanbacteria bacterium]
MAENQVNADAIESPHLIVTSPGKAPFVFQLPVGKTVIGRDADNDLVLDVQGVSRHHCQIETDGERHIVIDRDSKNGIELDGVRISGRAELSHQSRLAVGDAELTYHNRAQPAATRHVSATLLDAVRAQAQGTEAADARWEKIAGADFARDRLALRVRSGADAGTVFDLSGALFRIGRRPDSDVVLAHESVSLDHALIRRTPTHFVLHDLCSVNGVRVGGQPVDTADLINGSEISIGSVLLQVRCAPAPAADTRPAPRERTRGRGRFFTAILAALSAGAILATGGLFLHAREMLRVSRLPGTAVAAERAGGAPVGKSGGAGGEPRAEGANAAIAPAGDAAPVPRTEVPAPPVASAESSTPAAQDQDAESELVIADMPGPDATMEERMAYFRTQALYDYRSQGPDSALARLRQAVLLVPEGDADRSELEHLAESLEAIKSALARAVTVAAGGDEQATRAAWRAAVEVEAQGLPEAYRALGRQLSALGSR